MAATGNESWVARLNQDLKSLSTSGAYQSVTVLVLYWEDGDKDYQDEGREVRRMFEGLFRYNVTEFAIPSMSSYFHLLGLVSQALAKRDEHSGPGLFIIHYGGHGDRDDDKHSGQERRSVWAAHIDGEPTLEWYKIQDQIRASGTDILLLLDCCYAAQAARQREATKGKFEILAAAAMGVPTPAPGPNSFTRVLLKQIESTMQSGQGFVDIKDMHGQLCARQQKLFATPVHVCLKPGRHPIRLIPLKSAPASSSSLGDVIMGRGEETQQPKSFFRLIIGIKEELGDDSTEQVSRWLKTDVPWIVSRLEVLEQTESVGQAIGQIYRGSGVLGKRVRGSPVEEVIMRSWSKIVALVEEYHETSAGMAGAHPKAGTQSKRRRVGDFIRRLDAENGHIVDLIEQHILTSPGIIDGEDTLETAVVDNTAQALGMADQLRLCSLIRSWGSASEDHAVSDNPNMLSLSPPLIGESNALEDTLQETKRYGPYLEPRELPELARRVHLLAELLSAPKAAAFRSLQCIGWVHTPLTHSYTFQFRVPSMYAGHEHVPLSWIIQRTRGNHRPTLEERLGIAHMLARAVLKWHLVGWVHQGISSHSIIFFRDNTAESSSRGGRPNYHEPFLHGFEFARPDSDPSMGRALDDIEFNVYRHPDRQGDARKGHLKKHDIYSLGVVLLEIGLWQNLVDMFRNAAPSPKPMNGSDVAKTLRKHCTERLAHFAGTCYRNVVDLCLSGEFGVHVDDEFGSHLARAFQERVVDTLAKGVGLHS